MKNKPYVHKRILAYVLDIMIVAVISSLLTYFIPTNREYDLASEELAEVVDNYTNGKITLEEYTEKVNNLNYEMTSNSVGTTIITIVVSVLYFGVYNYYSHGETLGKKLMKIKIVGVNNQKLGISNYIIRSAILNGILVNIITMWMVMFMDKSLYIKYDSIVSTTFSFVVVLCFTMMLFRSDGRGLHDFLAQTVVVNKDDQYLEPVDSNKVKEKNETVIEEAKVVEKPKKNHSKQVKKTKSKEEVHE